MDFAPVSPSPYNHQQGLLNYEIIWHLNSSISYKLCQKSAIPTILTEIILLLIESGWLFLILVNFLVLVKFDRYL